MILKVQSFLALALAFSLFSAYPSNYGEVPAEQTLIEAVTDAELLVGKEKAMFANCSEIKENIAHWKANVQKFSNQLHLKCTTDQSCYHYSLDRLNYWRGEFEKAGCKW